MLTGPNAWDPSLLLEMARVTLEMLREEGVWGGVVDERRRGGSARGGVDGGRGGRRGRMEGGTIGKGRMEESKGEGRVGEAKGVEGRMLEAKGRKGEGWVDRLVEWEMERRGVDEVKRLAGSIGVVEGDVSAAIFSCFWSIGLICEGVD